MLTNLLSQFVADGAAQVIVSAVVTGAVTAIGVLIANVTGIVHADALGGLLVTGITMGLKALQKSVSDLSPKEVK